MVSQAVIHLRAWLHNKGPGGVCTAGAPFQSGRYAMISPDYGSSSLHIWSNSTGSRGFSLLKYCIALLFISFFLDRIVVCLDSFHAVSTSILYVGMYSPHLDYYIGYFVQSRLLYRSLSTQESSQYYSKTGNANRSHRTGARLRAGSIRFYYEFIL